MPAHVPSFGRNPRGSPDFLAYPVPKACMHVLGTRVPRCLGVARSASGPKAAQALGCSLTPGLRISFGRVSCMARAASVPGLWTLRFLLLCGVCVWVRVVFGLGFRLRPATPGWGVGVCVCFGPVPLVPRHSWLTCAAWVCVLGLGSRLRPATPGWDVGLCVCLCACSACTPPILAGVCGVGVCVWARVSAAPRQSWLGCPGLCVLVCMLLLYPANPGWGVRCGCVCLGWGFGCAPPLRAGVLGCACLFACSPCTPPLLAGVCGVGVCVWVRVSAAPRHPWLGCWGVCVLVCALRLYPTTPGWGVRYGCGCFSSGFGCAPLSWLGCAASVCVFGLGFRLRPATPGSGGGVCVCWCACSPKRCMMYWRGC